MSVISQATPRNPISDLPGYIFALLAGMMGSLGLVGLIDKIFGWTSLATLNESLHSAVVRVVGWWDFLAIGTTEWISSLFSLQAETNTIAASISMVLISTVGLQHFKFGLQEAVAKREPRPLGRPRKNKWSQRKKLISHYISQKGKTLIAFFKSDTWIASLMVAAYVVIVFAINFSTEAFSADTMKGMAYTVLIYSAFHALKQLHAKQAYRNYLMIMAGSTIVLLAISWYIQLSESAVI